MKYKIEYESILLDDEGFEFVGSSTFITEDRQYLEESINNMLDLYDEGKVIWFKVDKA